MKELKSELLQGYWTPGQGETPCSGNLTWKDPVMQRQLTAGR